MSDSLPQQILPRDAEAAVLIGRVWDPVTQGPRVVSVRGEEVFDLTAEVRTVAGLLEQEDPAALALRTGSRRWDLAEIVQASVQRGRSRPHLLAPIDLQVIKALRRDVR